MKRLSPREFLLVSAPLAIVALGIWGAQLREQRWPTKPRIVACRVRPATPLEISQGAEVGVTVQGVEPSSMVNPCIGSVGYSLLDSHGLEPHSKVKDKIDRKHHSQRNGGYIQLEESHAYKWVDLFPTGSPRVVEATMSLNCKGDPTMRQRFKLDPAGIAKPDVLGARRTNFRVTKATLGYRTSPKSSELDVKIYIQDVSDEGAGLMTSPECLETWSWQDEKHPLARTEFLGSSSDDSSVAITLYAPFFQWPPLKGTKFRGLLSFSEGWPQEIEVEVPNAPAASDGLLDLKFSTKLAPLPASAQK